MINDNIKILRNSSRRNQQYIILSLIATLQTTSTHIKIRIRTLKISVVSRSSVSHQIKSHTYPHHLKMNIKMVTIINLFSRKIFLYFANA